MEKTRKDFNGLRPAPYIVFAAAVWEGCRMYRVCGNGDCEGWNFRTKRDAKDFVKKNFTGDERAIRLYDLRHCTDMYNPKRAIKY